MYLIYFTYRYGLNACKFLTRITLELVPFLFEELKKGTRIVVSGKELPSTCKILGSIPGGSGKLKNPGQISVLLNVCWHFMMNRINLENVYFWLNNSLPKWPYHNAYSRGTCHLIWQKDFANIIKEGNLETGAASWFSREIQCHHRVSQRRQGLRVGKMLLLAFKRQDKDQESFSCLWAAARHWRQQRNRKLNLV